MRRPLLLRYWPSVMAALLPIACKAPAPAAQAEVAAKLVEDEGEHSSEGSGEVAIPRLEEHRFPLLVWAAFLVQSEYFDPSRFDLRAQLDSALDGLGREVPEFFGSISDGHVHVTVGAARRDFPMPANGSGFFAAVAVLEDVLDFVRERLALEGEELHEIEYATISGLFAPLDPHTILLTPKEHAELGVRTRGRFGGVGAVIREAGRGIRIEQVLADMPAAKAGLVSGDLLLAIDDRSTVDMNAQDAQERLRGPEGTVVRVKVQRGRKVLAVKVTRALIHFPAITFAALPNNVGYFELSTFQEECAQDLERELAKEPSAWQNGIILDLRRNAGGLLNEATALVDLFVESGELIAVHSAGGRETQNATSGVVVPTQVPLVVLVDEHSASASEIVAGGLQELGRAVIVGRTTFGKGSVQRVNDAQPYGRELALKMTVAEYRVANERRIQTLGVRPDVILIPVVLGDVPGSALYYDELTFEEAREHWQVGHLPSAKHERDIIDDRKGSPLRIRYLDQRVPVGAAVPTRMSEPEIRLAHELALALPKTPLGDRSTALQAFRNAVAQREEERSVEALRGDGIDFSGTLDATADLALDVQAKVVGVATSTNTDASQGAVIEAGKRFAIELRVTNRGQEAAQRVHVLSTSAVEELDRQEFLLGRIEAGATVMRKVELEVDAMRPALREKVNFVAYAGEPKGEPDGRAELKLQVEALPRPQFAFDWWIVDSPSWAHRSPPRPSVVRLRGETPFEVRGNGDGRLQAGEHVLLAVRVYNRGAAPAQSAQIVLRNHSSAQGLLEEDHHTFGVLPGGEDREISFGITLADDPKGDLPFELEVLAADGRTHNGVAHTLRVPIAQQVDPTFSWLSKAQATGFRSALQLRAEPSADAPVLGEVAEGMRAMVVARQGEWIGLEGSNGQRVWAQGGEASGSGKGAGLPELRRAMIEPPRLDVTVPLTVDGPMLKLRGTAYDDTALRDIVAWVAGVAPPQAERKVAYQAQSEGAGSPGVLAWEAEVPLVLGGNFIRVVARDTDKVAVESTYWVRRER